MVERPEEHEWSSYQAFVGQCVPPEWLQQEFILAYFSDKVKVAHKRYRNFVEGLLDKTYENPLKGAFAGILGDVGFVEEVRARHLEGKETGRDVPALRELIARPSPKQIIEASRRYQLKLEKDESLRLVVEKARDLLKI